MRKSLMVGIFGILCLSAQAEVISSAKNGFTIRIERYTDTTPQQAWQQFLKVGEWWNGDHTWFGKSQNLSIDPKAGGCFCEIDGKRQVLHMTVSYVDPGKELRMVGGLGPLQMMGVVGGMSWKFVPAETGGTTIIQQYQVTGYSPDGLDKLAPIVDKVQTIQQDGLVAKLKAVSSKPTKQ